MATIFDKENNKHLKIVPVKRETKRHDVETNSESFYHVLSAEDNQDLYSNDFMENSDPLMEKYKFYFLFFIRSSLFKYLKIV